MHSLFAILAAEAATNPAETWYSPGVIGFIATFGVTAAAVGLIFDMVRRVRRVRYRAEIEAKIAAEEAQAGSQEKQTPSKSATSKPRASKPTVAKAVAPKPPTARVKPARPEPPKKPSRD